MSNRSSDIATPPRHSIQANRRTASTETLDTCESTRSEVSTPSASGSTCSSSASFSVSPLSTGRALSEDVCRTPPCHTYDSHTGTRQYCHPSSRLTENEARPPPAPSYRIESVLEIANRWPTHGGHLVPQKLYCPPTAQSRSATLHMHPSTGHATRERPQLHPPIMFFLERPTYCGIPCRAALLSIVARLFGREERVFAEGAGSVTLRFLWPGYPPWCRQIPAHDYKTPPRPITRAALARNVARTVQRFLQEMGARSMQPGADRRWKVAGPGGGGITLDDLEIVGLQHVSAASWQVHLRCMRS